MIAKYDEVPNIGVNREIIQRTEMPNLYCQEVAEIVSAECRVVLQTPPNEFDEVFAVLLSILISSSMMRYDCCWRCRRTGRGLWNPNVDVGSWQATTEDRGWGCKTVNGTSTTPCCVVEDYRRR